ncbi:MAG: MBL fold metallo-hydrolase [Deltaproteobacteria bacterium]|nr:MBL fold metallo-hydrolase [Deltaproteobacteria bacterium]
MKHQFIWSVVAFGVALALCGPARAQDALGFAKITVGELTVTAFQDDSGRFGYGVFAGAAKEALQKAVESAGLEAKAGLPRVVNAFLVEGPFGKVMVDAGNGPRGGRLAQLLEAAGVDPSTVTTVLLTHFHGDHIGGLRDGEGRPLFPNAQALADENEPAYWLSGAGRAKGGDRAEEALASYVAAGRFKTFKGGENALPKVASVPLYGHTPGHVGFLFETGEKPLLFWGDVVHSSLVQFQHPEVTIQYDVDPQAAAASRQKIFAQAAAEGWLVAGAHLPFPALGRVVKAGDAHAWEPLP